MNIYIYIISAFEKEFVVPSVRTGLPVGVGIGSLPETPNRNGEIGVLCVESGLAGVPQHNKNMINEMNE